MKKSIMFISILISSLLIIASVKEVQIVETTLQADEFEILVPWGLDHERGKIIKSMIDNSSIANKYNYVYTQLGGGPADRDALMARLLASDYPDLIISTLDWYNEFAEFDIFHNFNSEISAWSGERSGWRTDILDGFWSILDLQTKDGTGEEIYALPFFGQNILPYINIDHFEDAGLNSSAIIENGWTMSDFEETMIALKAAGNTPFAMVGKLQSDIAYMNYMMASTNNLINSSSDPATVLSFGPSNEYGVNGSYSVLGFSLYMKMKGEGWVQSTVDTDGGGETNTIFGSGDASMVFCGPWGTSIFSSMGLSNFRAVDMPANLDGSSTIIGGGITWVPEISGITNTTRVSDAILLAEWLLEDENQMKTVKNWLDASWRIPVRRSVTNDPWFSAEPVRGNFLKHTTALDYSYVWGLQHPSWMVIHQAVMMPGYRDALLEVEYNSHITNGEYYAAAQDALNKMAANIQCFHLGGPCPDPPPVNIPPEVELIFPIGGEILKSSEGNPTIIWEMNDTDEDILTLEIEYSSNGGSSWISLINLTDVISYNWMILSLNESSAYRIRIIVTDGKAIAYDESGNFVVIQDSDTTSIPSSVATESKTSTTSESSSSEKSTEETSIPIITSFPYEAFFFALFFLPILLRNRKKFG